MIFCLKTSPPGIFKTMSEKFYPHFLIVKQSCRTIAALLFMATLVACVNDENTKTKYLERGKALMQAGNYEKARLEFKNVLQIDPKAAEPWYHLGQIAEQEQMWGQAFGSYRKAIELDENMMRARARLAQFYILQANAEQANGNTEGEQSAIARATAELETIFSVSASDAEALSIQASLMARNGDTEKAIEQLQSVIDMSPDHTPAIIMLAKILEKSGRPGEAREILEAGAGEKPDDEKILFALVQFYSNQGLHARAVASMHELIRLKPEVYSYRKALSAIFLHKGDADSAEKALRDAVLAAPEDQQRYLQLVKFLLENRSRELALAELQQFASSHPDLHELQLAIARYHLMVGDTGKAMAKLHDVIRKYRTDPVALRARNQLAQIYASVSQFEQARLLVNEVLEENPQDYDALLLKGRLAFQAGNYSDAIASFRSVLKEQPDAVTVLNYLAEAHLQLGETGLAGEVLLHAVNSNPYRSDARIRLARFYRQQGQTGLALKQVDKALEMQPGDSTLLTLKLDLMEDDGDKAGAREVIETLKTKSKDSSAAYIRSAKLYLSENRPEQALAEIDTALAGQPENLDALVVKADTLGVLNNTSELEPVLIKIRQLAPDQVGSHYRLGRYYLGKKQIGKAVSEYEAALEMASTEQARMQLLAEIVNIEVNNDRTSSARSRLETTLKNSPQHPIAHDLLGAIYMREKEYRQAEAEFEKQLAINAKSPIVYIQLAATRMARQDASGAIAALERGLRVLPGNEKLTLSLASTCAQNNRPEKAASLYAAILRTDPEHPAAINGAMALLDTTDRNTDLKRARQFAEAFSGIDHAYILDSIGMIDFRLGNYGDAESTFRRLVAQSPKTALFQYHLGMTLYKQGDRSGAKSHLARAIALGEFSGQDDARRILKKL